MLNRIRHTHPDFWCSNPQGDSTKVQTNRIQTRVKDSSSKSAGKLMDYLSINS